MPRRILAYAEPDDISGLVCWLKADALALNDGDPVDAWTDSSGEENTPVQATSNLQPVFKTNILNGKPVIRFASDRLVMPDETAFDLATPTIFVVFRRNSGTSGPVMSKSTTSTAGAGRRKMQVGTAGSSISYTSGGDASGIAVSATPTNWNMFGVSVASNTSHSMYLNGNQTDSGLTLSDSTTNDANMEIGSAFGGAEALNGDIAEIIVYDVPLAGSQVIGLQNYLSNKYGLTVSDALGGYPRTAVANRVHIAEIAGLRFDGVNDYVDIGSLGSFGTSLNNDGLCSFAFRMRTTSTAHSAILGVGNGALNTTLYIGKNRNSAGTTTTDKIGIFIRNNSNVYQNVGTTNAIDVTDGNLHHYVVQRVSRYVWEVWQDGVSKTMTNPSASGDLTSGFTNFNYGVCVGASGGSSLTSYSSLDLSELIIYQRALTQSEIENLYLGTIPSGAFRHFNLTQSNEVAIDSSANAINGVISGATLIAPRQFIGGDGP